MFDDQVISYCLFKTTYLLFRYWYSQAKRRDGLYYSPSTLICMRAAVHRHLTQPPINRTIDILHGGAFLSANNMLKALVYKSLSQKKPDEPDGISAIEAADLARLSLYFDR